MQQGQSYGKVDILEESPCLDECALDKQYTVDEG